jgi:anaerobic selenocysteine-containing dehydrogenase
MHKSLYSEDRIKTPLIRIGKRGHGEFREASWEEALSEVATCWMIFEAVMGVRPFWAFPVQVHAEGLFITRYFLLKGF